MFRIKKSEEKNIKKISLRIRDNGLGPSLRVRVFPGKGSSGTYKFPY